MIRKGLPLTREQYIGMNWSDPINIDDLDEEERTIIALLPSEGRNNETPR